MNDFTGGAMSGLKAQGMQTGLSHQTDTREKVTFVGAKNGPIPARQQTLVEAAIADVMHINEILSLSQANLMSHIDRLLGCETDTLGGPIDADPPSMGAMQDLQHRLADAKSFALAMKAQVQRLERL